MLDSFFPQPLLVVNILNFVGLVLAVMHLLLFVRQQLVIKVLPLMLTIDDNK